MAEPDIWLRWLLERRSGGDPELRRRILESSTRQGPRAEAGRGLFRMGTVYLTAVR